MARPPEREVGGGAWSGASGSCSDVTSGCNARAFLGGIAGVAVHSTPSVGAGADLAGAERRWMSDSRRIPATGGGRDAGYGVILRNAGRRGLDLPHETR
ncbi:hypothetical protein GCM10014713_05960 [Streptomyces purpureus]|uniref:Uncharacterized protein n=1 Tax=Streptomyces purpureus TaxID=1951 RepID=A0A918GYA2_9ACTN|nr:hypothetical protein GCM10014713_05960 [Streptomyces purpureus]